MTNEQAIRRLEDLQRLYLGNEKFTADIEAIGIAIEALQHKADLDKIKAEIERKCCITVGNENEPAITLYDVFQIIDKYKKSPTGAEGSEQ